MDTVEDIDAAINTVDCINKDVNGEENTNGGANRHEGDNHQEVSKQNAANGEDFETGKSGKEKAEEEASTLRREYNDIDMEEADNDEEQSEGGSDDSFIEHSHNEESSSSNNDGDLNIKVDLTESEIDELISELLEVESKAAEAQERLELESLKQVEDEVRAELALHLQGDELDIAVSTEMNTFVEQWELTLDELETECSLLLEQLDDGGVELPSLYKLIESQAPNGCSTDAWKKMTHWVGSQVTPEVKEVISNAEEHLESCRPLRRRHGKLLEEGAGGFLSKKMAAIGNENCEEKNIEKDWKSFNACVQSSKHAENTMSFGSINWASVYLASTPQQAAEMGLKFPGVDEVEEIDEISPIDSCDPLYADAVANEQFLQLSGENKQNFRKIREEDDILITKKLHNHLRRRRRKRWQDFSQNDACTVDQVMKDSLDKDLSGTCSVNRRSRDEGLCSGSLSKQTLGKDVLCCAELTGSHALSPSRDDRLLCQSKENDFANKAHDTVIIDSDEEDKVGYSLPAKEGNDIIDVDAFPDADAIKDFQCTTCSKYLHSSKVNKHPHLKVIICGHCKCAMEAKMHNKEAYPIELYCRWCGSSNDLKSCNSCDMLFCRTCIKRNLPDEQFSVLEASGWQCFSCTPTMLQKLISNYEKAFGSVVLSSSDNDSEYSDSDIHISLSKKKRRKRKIRRILDDTELGEETKLKIEMEKARQEHLRSMHFSGNRCRNEASVNTAEEGDAKNGYIINVAREEDEESVRIPPSISSKLKSHQIEGIRFLWQNIIQSVRKVKFGDKGLGCILAHTMGLGKTLQVIGFLYTALRCTDLGLKTALIVTPVNVLHNWRHEFRKWRPLEVEALRVFMLEDVPRERRPYLLSKWRRKGGVLLIGYAAFRNLSFGKHEKDKSIAREIACALQAPDILVCDEAHMIKNVRADVTQALKQVKTQRRIALTGSPLQNNLMEYYCMVDFVREGFLGSSHEFRNRFQNPIENGQHANSTRDDVKIMNQRSHILYEQLKGFVQRRDMNVVKNELPPKTVYVISVKLSPLQKKLYKRFLDVHGFTNKEVSNDKTGRLRCFFAGYQALARIWNHPGLLQLVKEHRDKLLQEDIVENFLGDDAYSDDSSSDGNLEHAHIRNGDDRRSKDDSSPRINVNAAFGKDVDWWKDIICEKIYKEVDHSGKIVLLLEILSMSAEIGDKTLVFSQSLATLDLIESFLSKLLRNGREAKFWKKGKDWYRLDGSTKGSERQNIIERFNEPSNRRVKCTLISTRAGSLGINLHAANRVVIVDGSWNPTHDLQAIYRSWRYGQIKPVYAYRLMAHGTMEEKIYKRQVTKEGLSARIMDRQQIHRTMSKEEMLHLFDFGDDENIESVLEQSQQMDLPSNHVRTSGLADFLKQKSLSVTKEVGPSDEFMVALLNKYYPRWIQDYHEHETLLQENEDERLSKEEKDMALENFLRTIEWEEVHRVSDVSSEKKLARNPPPAAEESRAQRSQENARIRSLASQRKCSNLSHLLTLRSQGTKSGSTAVCGECSQEISWENLSRDRKR